MEVELVTEEDTFGVDDQNYDYATLEGERCGICMDIVIDRGVLDCCQHWFCFACIDNWATITNLCPLCQNEFQLITCVPVYDTIGSNNADDDLNSGEDDWCIEGKNNTLSFPSYYIDENAVVCLDGDGCKIRSGSAAVEEDPNLDTSIACDSCDIWYHAFCVGFDPEGTCENSWLCPRCVAYEMPQNSDVVSVMRPSNQLHPENASSEYLAEAALSGKVSVSVADVGETAVVVSMVEREESAEEPNGKSLLSLDVCTDMKIDTLISGSGAYKHKFGTSSNQMIKIEPDLEAHELGLSLSQVTSFDLPSSQLVFTELKTNSNDEATIKQSVIDEIGISSSKKFGELYNNEPHEPGLDLHLGISAGPSLSVDKMNNNIAEDQVDVDVQLKPGLEECLLPADKIVLDKTESVFGTTGAKRKHRDWSGDYPRRGVEDEEMKAKIQTKLSSKIVKAGGISQLIYPKNQADKSVSDHRENFPSPIAVCKGQKSRRISDKGNNTANIMDIVQGTDRRPVKRLALSKLAGTSSTERENAAGLRVKKIMRRTNKEESSMLVQNLRKEIREAVRNRSSKEFGDNLYDPKLLAAFRAAVAAGPITENKRPPPLDLRAKKSLFQKGKIRESLTKKIYGSGGKRRHGWTRDCEIEFWKHRCLKFSRPEKIETLKSVLNLLRKSPESTEIKNGSERGSTGSILSRLYLADSSVFPRKDDIKPLSAINASETRPLGNTSAKGPQTNAFSSQVIVPKFDNEGTKSTIPSIKGETSSSKVHPNRSLEGSSLSTSDKSKADSQKETVGKSDDIKTDKRKWALQVLARKTEVTGKNTAQEKQDTAVLKGNYPLLAQLPADMRPVLAPSRHNKIPISLRQTQLHRLTEHFLRKANTPVTQITAEIELAVADAVNIEKEVANRSNSKLVYVNLCSQELLHRSDNTLSGKATECNPNLTSANHAEKSEELPNGLSSCSEVEEALRNAGLLSDSPPNSPHHQIEEVKEEVDPSKNIKEEEPDNVFEIDSQQELDIYGDFEYDLEEEDFIGASTLKISKLEPEESKLKVVFSTLDSDRSNAAQGSENHEEQATVEVPKGSSGLTDCENDTSTISSTTDNKTDECPPEELSVAECEELYGPDKEPLIKRFPESALMKPYQLIPNNIDLGYNEDRESMKESEPTKVVHDSSGGKDSPNRSQKKVPRKEKISITQTNKFDGSNSVRKKVESYIKEHVRPLCKSGVITVEQYRWAVGKTSDKIMKYHSKDTNANFLIKEGEKVKKLAEQYVETAQKTGKCK